MYKILVLNPGSTSTKVAVYEDENCLLTENLPHTHDELAQCGTVMEQAPLRREALLAFLKRQNYSLKDFSAIVVRGGQLKPLAGGVYRVDREMYADLESCRYGTHASNLGIVIALPLAEQAGLPAYTVDPVTVDEFEETARFSGLKSIPRLSMSHALNIRAAGRQVASSIGKKYEDLNLVVVHLGSGISVSAHRRGRMVDVNNANNEGPFSLERCGTLPALALIDLCYSGRYTHREALELVTSKGGIFSYLGTKDFREVEKRVEAGEEEARLVVEVMAYQVGKEIGAMAAVLSGEVDRIVLTGGMAFSALLTDLITKRVSFLAPVVILPGEGEMEALSAGALRVLRGEEQVRAYRDFP